MVEVNNVATPVKIVIKVFTQANIRAQQHNYNVSNSLSLGVRAILKFIIQLSLVNNSTL
jgi:hypothetical protein